MSLVAARGAPPAPAACRSRRPSWPARRAPPTDSARSRARGSSAAAGRCAHGRRAVAVCRRPAGAAVGQPPSSRTAGPREQGSQRHQIVLTARPLRPQSCSSRDSTSRRLARAVDAGKHDHPGGRSSPMAAQLALDRCHESLRREAHQGRGHRRRGLGDAKHGHDRIGEARRLGEGDPAIASEELRQPPVPGRHAPAARPIGLRSPRAGPRSRRGDPRPGTRQQIPRPSTAPTSEVLADHAHAACLEPRMQLRIGLRRCAGDHEHGDVRPSPPRRRRRTPRFRDGLR